MQTARIVGFLGALALLGCSNEVGETAIDQAPLTDVVEEDGTKAVTLTFAIDDTFTADEADQLRKAGDAWNARTSTRKLAFIGSDLASADAWQVAHPGEALWSVLKADVPGGLCGRAENARRLIRVNPACSSDRVYAIGLHEFGHALALGHLCDASWNYAGEAPSGRACDPARPLGVMDPSVPVIDFSDDDMAECRRVGTCR